MQSKNDTYFNNWCTRLLFVVLACYILFVLREYFTTMYAYPMVTTDDALAALAYSLREHGWYGFLSSPLQAPTHYLRHDAFYNYGPIYFYFAALLSWFFGYSLHLVRFIALFLYILAGFVGSRLLYKTYDRTGLSSVVFVLLLTYFFDVTHMIIARPDTMVAFLSLVYLFLATKAMETNSKRYWLFTGFFAASAAFSHLFAWSVVLASVLILIFSVLLQSLSDRHFKFKSLITSGLSLFTGGLIGAIVFFGSFKFRISDFIGFISTYKNVHFDQSRSYIDTIEAHLLRAFWPIPTPFMNKLTFTLLLSLSGFLLVIHFYISKKHKLVALIAPPSITFLTFIGILGSHKWVSGYYSVTPQFISFWLMATILVGLFNSNLKLRNIEVKKLTLIATYSVIFIFFIARIALYASEQGTRFKDAKDFTPINEYFYESMRGIPSQAKVWGTIMYGNETPDRLQLIQAGEAITIMHSIPEEQRDNLLPEFILWGLNEQRDSTIALLSKGNLSNSPLYGIKSLLSSKPAELLKITFAPPYGRTYLYKVGLESGVLNKNLRMPEVSIYEPYYRSWFFPRPNVAEFTEVPQPAGKFKVSFSEFTEEVEATSSTLINTFKGYVLIEVTSKIDNALPSAACVSSKLNTTEVVGYLPPSLVTCEPFALSDKAYLIWKNTDSFYLSTFGKIKRDNINIRVYSLKIESEKNYNPNLQPEAFYINKMINIYQKNR